MLEFIDSKYAGSIPSIEVKRFGDLVGEIIFWEKAEPEFEVYMKNHSFSAAELRQIADKMAVS